MENDFSKGSISKNIISMAVPMTLAQLINLFYSIVDRIYLGRLPSHYALTGLGLCLPIISIIMGFANLCSMGGAPLCSISRGMGDNEEAPKIQSNSFTLLIIFGIILTLIGFIFKKPILYLFGASDMTFPYANDYLSIYLIGTLFVMISLGMNPFINSQGFSKIGMITVSVGAAINIILDPIFIYGLGLGVKGAAIATVISQGCSAIWVLKFLTGKKAILKLKYYALELKRVTRILSLGLSGFAMSMTNSLTQVVCNATLENYSGDLYVGVMTIINSIREVISMPITGITSGSQPVLSYNYGAGENERVLKAIRFTTLITMTYSVISWIIVMLMPEILIRLFNNEPELILAGVPAFRIYYATFFFMSFQMIGQSVFVGLGKSKSAIFFSLLRKAFIVAPLTLILPFIGFGTNGVFLAEPISNVIGGLACIITMYFTVYRPLKKRSSL